MLTASQVVFLGALSAPLVQAFSPIFSTPRQCESLSITWFESSLDLPVVDMPLSEVLFQLIPLDNDASRIAPEPYTVSVPSGGHDIAILPFPAGTQFFASAHILGSAGFTRRTVSNIFTVGHSEKSDCLPSKVLPADGRAKAKTFGKRQISVVGPSLVGATGAPAPVNAIASPSSSGASPTSSSSSGVTPPIRVIGTSNIPASDAPDAPANAAPAPAASSSGPVPPIKVIGTSVVPATGDDTPAPSSSDAGASEPSPTSTDSDYTDATTTSTSCTETPTALPEEAEISTETPPSTITVPYGGYTDVEDEEPCEESMEPSEHQSMHGTDGPSESEMTRTALPAATHSANTEVVHYSAFDEMVNAANSMFKAWNPYMPAYTPSA